MTTYAFPSYTPNASSLRLLSNVKRHTDPLAGFIQTSSRPGTRWGLMMDFTNLNGATRQDLIGFLVQLDGATHRFTVKDHSHTFRGTLSGSVLVNGASQTGNSIVLDGAGAATTILRGDQFSIGGELKMATADATADGSGNITVSFVPEIHTSPADNSAVVYSDPTGIFMLQNDVFEWSNRPGVFSNLVIEAIEDISA